MTRKQFDTTALKFLSKSLLTVVAALMVSVLLTPTARADIFKIEGPGPCPGNIGAGLCNGSTPFSLTSFLNGGTTFDTANGTFEWVLQNDTGQTLTNFSFVFNGSVADNASCQIANSHGATLTNPSNTCSIVDSLGHTTSLGGTQIGGGGQFFTPAATITFGGLSIASGASFDLDFVSMQGTGTATGVPEPASLLLLCSGLGSVAGFWRRRKAA